MFCTKCGKEYEGGTCPNCGAEQAIEVTPQEQQAPMPQQQKPKKKKSTIIAIVIVAIVVLAIKRNSAYNCTHKINSLTKNANSIKLVF